MFYAWGKNNCGSDKLNLGACVFINKSGLIVIFWVFLKGLIVDYPYCLNGCKGALRIM